MAVSRQQHMLASIPLSGSIRCFAAWSKKRTAARSIDCFVVTSFSPVARPCLWPMPRAGSRPCRAWALPPFRRQASSLALMSGKRHAGENQLFSCVAFAPL